MALEFFLFFGSLCGPVDFRFPLGLERRKQLLN